MAGLSLRLHLFGRKTFSSYSDVCFAVKPRSTENVCSLTGKSLCKLRKTVYGKFSVNHFPKYASYLSRLILLSLSLCSLSFSLSALFSSLSRATEPPPAIPSHPQHPGLISTPFLSFSARFLSRLANPSQTKPPRRPPSHQSTLAPIPPSHGRTTHALHRSASPKVTPTVAQLDLI